MIEKALTEITAGARTNAKSISLYIAIDRPSPTETNVRTKLSSSHRTRNILIKSLLFADDIKGKLINVLSNARTCVHLIRIENQTLPAD